MAGGVAVELAKDKRVEKVFMLASFWAYYIMEQSI